MILKNEDYSDIHELHYKECGLLIDWVDRIAWHFQLSRSGMIVKMLQSGIPLLDKFHFKRMEQDSRYKRVEKYCHPKKNYLNRKDDIKEIVSIHCYMPEVLYRKLKQVKSDLNFYSIAQLVRELVRFFLWLFDRYGSGCLSLLESFRKNREKLKAKFRRSGYLLRQLSAVENNKAELSINYTRKKQIAGIRIL